MDIEKINELLDKEVEYDKKCGMSQFVMGILQAQKVLNDYNEEKYVACTSIGYEK